MATGSTEVRFGDVARPFACAPQDGVVVRTWADRRWCQRGSGTTFVLTCSEARLVVVHGDHALAANAFAVLPEGGSIEGGCGVAITVEDFSGLFVVGGPVEATGRLHYIDGCSDTVLVAPVVRGAPCLNLLHLPAGTRQTPHHHPSVRVGLVVEGRGECVLDGDRCRALARGTVFVIPAGTVHRFETAEDGGLLLMAWHPDSDTGPTDDDHPMLNRTLRPGSGLRVR